MARKYNISISFKLIVLMSLLITLSLGGMIYLATYYFKNDNIVRAEEITLDRASLISLKVKTDFESIIENSALRLEKAISTKSETPIFKDNDLLYIGQIHQTLSEKPEIKYEISNTQSLLSMGLDKVNSADIIAAEEDPIRGGFNTEIKVFNGSLYFNNPVIGIIAPYKVTAPGNASSIMLIFISMNRFLDAVKSDTIYQSFIVNGSGELIAHYDSSLVAAKANFKNMPLVEKMLGSTADNGKIAYTDSNKNAFIGSFRKTGFSDIGVVTFVEEARAFAAVYKIQRRNIIITIIIINIAIILLYIFSKSLTRPIRALSAAANQIKNGDFAITLKPTTRDEIGYLTESFGEMALGLSEREKLKSALGKFANPEIAEQAMKGEIQLGGERKYAAIFFSDIRNFTSISEKLEPEAVVDFLNQYMSRMVHCVNDAHGMVDKFIGDAIMALWGVPFSHGNDTENAIDCALNMRKILLVFNQNRGGDKNPLIKIGCGINVGPMVAGQIGSDEKMEYTVIGDTVNLASRIEALNKPFGTDILISEDAYQKVNQTYRLAPMRKILVKGKKKPQQIYAVLSRKDDTTGIKSIEELRKVVGIEHVDIPESDFLEEETKYQILDETGVKPKQNHEKLFHKKEVLYEILD
ncbi:MAG: HAMP domain-containing protein [Spirochaetes bacterium]|jgi:adenylate cyclase|nr:HAMP domain-containing protein [Spirochaetota bacterium]